MTEDEIFETWAPRGGRWSLWVKPVLFAYINSVSAGDPLPSFPGLEGVGSAPRTAVVIDLPGDESVAAALTIAPLGWQPVPLFNALPSSLQVAVNVYPIIHALQSAAPTLATLHLSSSASPAFLLDSRRAAPGWGLAPQIFQTPGVFDNRSISLPTDFPSAAKLREHGISRVLLIQRGTKPASDLAHTLHQWQKDGLVIERLEPAPNARPQPCPILKANRFVLWWMKLTSFFAQRPPGGGAFGRTIMPSSG